MKITASQLRKIIAEEVKNVSLIAEAAASDTYMRVKDTDNGKSYVVFVQEGTQPYTVSIAFGSDFSIELNVEDAQSLCNAIMKASVEV